MERAEQGARCFILLAGCVKSKTIPSAAANLPPADETGGTAK
jgi:hypothetical protein